MDTRRVSPGMDLVDSQPRNLGASGSVEDDHRAKSIGLEPTDYGLKG